MRPDYQRGRRATAPCGPAYARASMSDTPLPPADRSVGHGGELTSAPAGEPPHAGADVEQTEDHEHPGQAEQEQEQKRRGDHVRPQSTPRASAKTREVSAPCPNP